MRIRTLPGPRLTTICGTLYTREWCGKWPSRGAPRASMQRGCVIIILSATVAAKSMIWSGSTYRSPPLGHSVSGFFASAKSLFGDCARSVLRGAPPVAPGLIPALHRSVGAVRESPGVHRDAAQRLGRPGMRTSLLQHRTEPAANMESGRAPVRPAAIMRIK